MGKLIKKNLIGKKFRYLTVLKNIGKRKSRWLCKCHCGKERVFNTSDLVYGHNTSCGCMGGKQMIIHSLWGTRFYRIYNNLKRRCRDEKNENYARYGGRGIKCLWETALDFKNDMYESYLEHVKEYGEEETQIERVNNDGNYSKENCKWATRREQNRNRVDNVFIKYKGEKMIVSDYAEKIGVNKRTIYSRIARGWNNDKIINERIHIEFSKYA